MWQSSHPSVSSARSSFRRLFFCDNLAWMQAIRWRTLVREEDAFVSWMQAASIDSSATRFHALRVFLSFLSIVFHLLYFPVKRVPHESMEWRKLVKLLHLVAINFSQLRLSLVLCVLCVVARPPTHPPICVSVHSTLRMHLLVLLMTRLLMKR